MKPYQPPPPAPLEYLYRDEYLLVVNKPAGLLSVPGRGPEKQDCLVARVQQQYPDALAVHRLDMETSGLLLLARGKAMERALSILFQQRRVYKNYSALLAGQLIPEYGCVHLPLQTDWPRRPRQKVDWQHGKVAETHYQVQAYETLPGLAATRVRLIPITGRSHQLRVHCAHLGHPIVGDSLYAPKAVQQQASRLLLHARCLKFTHPVAQKCVNIEQPEVF